MRDVWADIWAGVVSTQPAPTSGVIVATAVVAAALVIPRPAWSVTRHVVTLVHEAAHGVAALVTGRRLEGIRLHSDTSGLTVSRGRASGPGMVATTAAGYVGPAALGLGVALALGAGYAVAVLWGLLLLLVLLLVQIRNWFGLWSVTATGAVVFAVSWWLPGPAQSAFAFAVAWFLLLAAPRPVVEMQRQRRRRRARQSDADQLARLTGMPAIVWVGIFLGVTVGALLLGASLLVL